MSRRDRKRGIMTWVRLDDGFFRHPKALAVGKDGRALYLAGLCWSSSNLTDGHLPAASLPTILHDAQTPRATVDRLVEHGLWHPTGAGWEIHNYLDRNRSRGAVEGERKKWAERQTRRRTNGEGEAVSRGKSRRDTPSDSDTRPW
jgi:hypothetical protein